MRLCAWWLNTISHVEFGTHEPCENRDITFFTCHVTIVSCDRCRWWPLLISHINFKFGRHGLREVEICFLFVIWPHVTTWTKEYVTLKFVAFYEQQPHRFYRNGNMFFTCHVIWYVHLINRLYDLVDNTFVMWSPDHVIKGSHCFAGGDLSH